MIQSILASIIALAFVVAGCADDAAIAEPPDAGLDGGERDAGEMTPALVCTCEAAETCSACFQHIGRCCYEDELVRGLDSRMPMGEALARRCELDPACRACCDECTALSCEQLIATNSCPPVNP